jgi:hypothetical protein
MIYKRYEFNDQEQAEEKIDVFFDVDEDGKKSQNIKAAFIKLNKFVLEQGEYDEEGEEITAPVLTSGFAVDVLWKELDESPYGWKSYEVEPKNPKHRIF